MSKKPNSPIPAAEPKPVVITLEVLPAKSGKRRVLVSAAPEGEMPILLSGLFADRHHLIDEAWATLLERKAQVVKKPAAGAGTATKPKKAGAAANDDGDGDGDDDVDGTGEGDRDEDAGEAGGETNLDTFEAAVAEAAEATEIAEAAIASDDSDGDEAGEAGDDDPTDTVVTTQTCACGHDSEWRMGMQGEGECQAFDANAQDFQRCPCKQFTPAPAATTAVPGAPAQLALPLIEGDIQ